MSFKTADEAMEARTHAAARIGHHLQRAAHAAQMELGALGYALDLELAHVATWRLKWQEAEAGFQRLNNAYQDELETRNAG